MGHALLWIESLGVALLLVALVAACSARWGGRVAQAAPPVLAALLLLALAGVYVWGVEFLRDRGAIGNYPVRYAWSWAVALGIGSVVVLAFALWRTEPDRARAGRAWPRSRLAVALLVLLAVDYVTFTNLDLSVKVEMAAVRADAGARATALAPPRVPDRHNAALVYRQAFEALAKAPAAQRERWVDQGWEESTPFDPASNELKQFLDTQQRGLGLFRKGAAMPDCSFDYDYQEGFAMRMPELQQLRDAARVLLLEALAKAHAGDVSVALKDVALALGAAKHLNDPAPITFLVARAIERECTHALEAILAHADPRRPEDLAPLLAEPELHSRAAVLRCLRLEEVTAAALFASLTDSSGSQQGLEYVMGEPNADSRFGALVLASSFYRVFFLSDDLAAYRLAMRQFQQALAHPYPKAHHELDRLDKEFRHYQGGILTRLLMPAVSRFAAGAAKGDVNRELRRLAVAVTAYRLETKKLPDRMDELTPKHLAQPALDPFDGQPLRMKRDGKDLLLYSIGPNLRDDGGERNPKSDEGDLVFRIRGQ